MDFTAIGTLFSTVGFPIGMALLLFWQNNTVIKANTDATAKLVDAIDALSKSLKKE